MIGPVEVPGVFAPAECDRILALASARGFADAGLVRGERVEEVRAARIAWLDEGAGADWALSRVVETVIETNRVRFGFDLTEFAEKMQAAWYGAARGGHFDWHVDVGDGRIARRRKLTVVVQLSDPDAYAGGALEINATGRPEPAARARGGAVLFPSFLPHRVSPVTKGERWSLTTWVHGPPFR